MKWWLPIVCFVLVIPVMVFAQPQQAPETGIIPTDLVPCGDAGQSSCQACHLYELAENVTQWFFGVSAIIVSIIIVVSGYRLVTSRGNAQAKRDARKMIGAAVAGFILVMSAWLLIELLIATLAGAEDSSGIWSSIQCWPQPVLQR